MPEGSRGLAAILGSRARRNYLRPPTELALLRQRHHSVEVERITQRVRHHDGTRFGPDGFFELCHVGVAGCRVRHR